MLSENKTSRTSSVITIDGPAGAGKSTVAKRLAKELGYSYVDTGAMYRALTLKAMLESVDLLNEDLLVALAKKTVIDMENCADGIKVLLDQVDVSKEIRSIEVTNNTHYIASAPKVRAIMVQWQRDIGGRKNIVVEGRDVGTVVFPKATYKFYLDANLDERSKRRIQELQEKGNQVEAEILKLEMKQRDEKDITRKVGPLKQARDAVFIDSTHLSIDEVVNKILSRIRNI